MFTARLKTNAWLTKPTLAQAQDKLEKLNFAVGFPDEWIDYSMVDIRRDDAFGNLLRLQEAINLKDQKSVSKPPHRDGFANAKATLPIIINAAYNPQINGFEVPAAILQPPAFEPEQDAAVSYCKLGAVIGHEMTHGFDSNGRNFDANGNMRDWWTASDSAAFQREADKLIAQANAFEVLPGLALNGAQTVTENMADAGGITLAYEALQHYLAEYPEENKPIDGLTPDQRCFIAWAQLWTRNSCSGAPSQRTTTRRILTVSRRPCSMWMASTPPLASGKAIPCGCHRRSASRPGDAPRRHSGRVFDLSQSSMTRNCRPSTAWTFGRRLGVADHCIDRPAPPLTSRG